MPSDPLHRADSPTQPPRAPRAQDLGRAWANAGTHCCGPLLLTGREFSDYPDSIPVKLGRYVSRWK